MKTFERFCIVIGVLLVPLSALAQEPVVRLAGLSPERAFAESAPGKAGMARLAALKEKQTRDIAARNQALESRERAFRETAGVLSDRVRSQRTRELEKFRVDVRRFIEDAQADFLGEQRDVESTFLVKLRTAVEQVARDRRLQLVFNLDGDVAVWADPALDITSEVVKQLARAEVPRP